MRLAGTRVYTPLFPIDPLDGCAVAKEHQHCLHAPVDRVVACQAELGEYRVDVLFHGALRQTRRCATARLLPPLASSVSTSHSRRVNLLTSEDELGFASNASTTSGSNTVPPEATSRTASLS